jgi:hypothetical protein
MLGVGRLTIDVIGVGIGMITVVVTDLLEPTDAERTHCELVACDQPSS